jgi:micrococcal nuclease
VDDLFLVAGFAALVAGGVAVVKGSVAWLHIPSRKTGAAVLGAGFVALLVAGALAPAGTNPRESREAVRSGSPLPQATLVPQTPAAPPAPVRPAGVPAEAQEATVTRHVDGDTLWLEGGTLPPQPAKAVRLLEMDTPEAGAARSEEATSFLEHELPIGASVYLLADRGDTDSFGRYLRYLWKANGEFFNEMAVRQGYAKAVMIAPNDRFISQIRAAEDEAKAARRGIWSAPAPVAAPPAPAPRNPAAAPAPRPAPAPAPAPPAAGGGCDPSYPDFCIPPSPPDLNCADIGRSFTVRQPDPHNFDGRAGQAGEPDGVGCESYG